MSKSPSFVLVASAYLAAVVACGGAPEAPEIAYKQSAIPMAGEEGGKAQYVRDAKGSSSVGTTPATPETQKKADCDHGYLCIANCWGGAYDWFPVEDWGYRTCTANAKANCRDKGADGVWGVCVGHLLD